MSLSPPASLVRLREADVVRLCGLDAAAQGLEYAARHQLAATKRRDARLDALVGEGEPARVWVELSGDVSLAAMRWCCSHHAGHDASDAPDALAVRAGEPGCAHVAGVLTAWIRSPHDFLAPVAAERSTDTPVPPAAPRRPHLGQPALLSTPAAGKPKTPVTLADELARLSNADALALARRVLGADVAEHEARPAVVALLSDSARAQTMLARLDAEPRALLGEIALLGGTITSSDLESLAARAQCPLSAVREHIAVLRRHALLFPIVASATSEAGPRADHAWGRFTGWRIPPELRDALGAVLPLAPLAVARPNGPPLLAGIDASSQPSGRERSPHVAQGSPRALLLALALLARAPRPYGISGASPPSAPSSAPSSEARAAASEERDPLRPRTRGHTTPLLAGELDTRVIAEFARGAGVPVGVARLARRVLLWARENGAEYPLDTLASIPSPQRLLALRAGFQLWRFADAPAELVDLQASDQVTDAEVRLRYDTAHPAFRPAMIADEASQARQFILRLVERAQPRVWYALDDLVALVWRLNPLFLRGRQVTFAAPAWWLERADTRRPLRPSIHEEWVLAEGAYIRALVSGPLHWWGICDVAADATGRPVAFRQTALGAYLLALHGAVPAGDSHTLPLADWGPAVLPTREGALAVQPLAAGGALLDALQDWARVSGVAGGRLVYTLSPELVCEALDGGLTPDVLLECLRAADTTSASRAATLVADRLKHWQAEYGRARITSGWALLEARDVASLAEALAYVPAIAARCRRLSPEIALVPSDDLPSVRAALAKRGYHL